MGLLTAASIITTRVRPVLHDTNSSSYRWSDTLMLAWINDAARFVVQCNPKAYVTNSVWQLERGTVQHIPTNGIELIDIPCNYTYASGVYSTGAAITLTDKAVVNALDPSWRSATASATVELWMFDERDPTHFEVYPQQPDTDTGYVLGIYSLCPTDLTDITQVIVLNDVYASPMINYLLFRAYSEETDANALQQAVGYYNIAVTELDRKDLIMKTYDPNKARLS